jgi:serine/threonine protein kinase
VEEDDDDDDDRFVDRQAIDDLPDGTLVVVKKTKSAYCEEERRMYAALSPHVTITNLLGTRYMGDGLGCLIMEAILLPDQGSASLYNVIQQHPRPSREFVAGVLCSAAQGLARMHDLHVVFADVKLENVLVDVPAGVAKWCDFGHAKAHWPTLRPTGTPGAAAPEQVVPNQFGYFKISPATDVWSFGVMVLEAFSTQDLESFPGPMFDILDKYKSKARTLCEESEFEPEPEPLETKGIATLVLGAALDIVEHSDVPRTEPEPKTQPKTSVISRCVRDCDCDMTSLRSLREKLGYDMRDCLLAYHGETFMSDIALACLCPDPENRLGMVRVVDLIRAKLEGSSFR